MIGQTGLPLGCALVPLVTRDPAYPDDKLNRVIITGQVAAAGRTSGLVASLLLPFNGRRMISDLLLWLQRHLNNVCWDPDFVRIANQLRHIPITAKVIEHKRKSY